MIKIEATEKELQALMAIIDASLKIRGVQGAGDAVNWVIKIEAAMKEATPA